MRAREIASESANRVIGQTAIHHKKRKQSHWIESNPPQEERIKIPPKWWIGTDPRFFIQSRPNSYYLQVMVLRANFNFHFIIPMIFPYRSPRALELATPFFHLSINWTQKQANNDTNKFGIMMLTMNRAYTKSSRRSIQPSCGYRSKPMDRYRSMHIDEVSTKFLGRTSLDMEYIADIMGARYQASYINKYDGRAHFKDLFSSLALLI